MSKRKKARRPTAAELAVEVGEDTKSFVALYQKTQSLLDKNPELEGILYKALSQMLEEYK